MLAASPNTGVNTITREGLAEAVNGAEVVVDVANAPAWDDECRRHAHRGTVSLEGNTALFEAVPDRLDQVVPRFGPMRCVRPVFDIERGLVGSQIVRIDAR